MEYDAKTIAKMFDNVPTKDKFDDLVSSVEGIDARLAELGKSQEVIEDPDAELEARGFFDDIMNFEFQGIPVGQAAVGGFAAIFASELVDGFMADMQPWQRGLVKIAVAGVSLKFGKRFLGSTGSKAVALLLTFDAIRDLSPIDSWADQLAEKITGRVTTAGLAGNPTGPKPAPANPGTSPKSYYAMALGGGA
jgi:hypothetical protein